MMKILLRAPAVALLGLVLGAGPGGGAAEKEKGPPTGEVSGKVILPDGKPLPAGWVTFHGQSPRDTVRVNVDGGKYTARAVPVGKGLRVTVDVDGVRQLAEALRERAQALEERAALKGKAADKALARQLKETKARLKVAQEMERRLEGIKVPPVFATRETTPLRFTVKPGAQTIDLRLREGEER
jgi:hypothetical protein